MRTLTAGLAACGCEGPPNRPPKPPPPKPPPRPPNSGAGGAEARAGARGAPSDPLRQRVARAVWMAEIVGPGRLGPGTDRQSRLIGQPLDEAAGAGFVAHLESPRLWGWCGRGRSGITRGRATLSGRLRRLRGVRRR